MKNRFVLIIVPVIAVMALLAIFLTGGPAEEGAQVASLGANEKAKQRVVRAVLPRLCYSPPVSNNSPAKMWTGRFTPISISLRPFCPMD